MKRLLFYLSLIANISALAQTNPPPTGKLIDIGGYRLHLDVRGKGNPTVVLIAGATAFSLDWSLVIPAVASFSRVCAYDRPSLAWSDPGPAPRTFDLDVYELHTLLKKAGIAPPYVLVGHSLGGIIARRFEKKYPEEVKGLVLVDPTSEDAVLFMNNKIQRLRNLGQGRAIPPVKLNVDTMTKVPAAKELEDLWKMIGEPTTSSPFDRLPLKIQQARIWALRQPKILLADNGGYWAEEFAAMYADSLYKIGTKPLFVLSGAMDVFSMKADSSMQAISIEKLAQRERIANLSTNSKHLITTRSGHEIHLSEPGLVVNAIKAVVTAVRTGAKL